MTMMIRGILYYRYVQYNTYQYTNIAGSGSKWAFQAQAQHSWPGRKAESQKKKTTASLLGAGGFFSSKYIVNYIQKERNDHEIATSLTDDHGVYGVRFWKSRKDCVDIRFS